MATQQSRPRIGVLVLSPDFVKSFRLFHFRRKEMESQEVKYVVVPEKELKCRITQIKCYPRRKS
ncbi:hypothetical protein LEP1GSC029_0233 [Leptospira interrogans str. 2002000626]|uniref:Uncharacterized protein n=2 Tax=Leptospira interrogans TaxID=173 RepID=A0A829D1F3_LEPIR|nr:hypothetical protein LEP1GSC029_0233 [Leptospira interrogans str. 2002000626]EMY24742.1 hypothetical protein LEP1GSC115_0384 [Leptospira interrogans serovar Australis str. 200703203]OOB95932.1 hypothetical protein B0192_19685 [Leptospira interrogans serovar Australis]